MEIPIALSLYAITWYLYSYSILVSINMIITIIISVIIIVFILLDVNLFSLSTPNSLAHNIIITLNSFVLVSLHRQIWKVLHSKLWYVNLLFTINTVEFLAYVFSIRNCYVLIYSFNKYLLIAQMLIDTLLGSGHLEIQRSPKEGLHLLCWYWTKEKKQLVQPEIVWRVGEDFLGEGGALIQA